MKLQNLRPGVFLGDQVNKKLYTNVENLRRLLNHQPIRLGARGFHKSFQILLNLTKLAQIAMATPLVFLNGRWKKMPGKRAKPFRYFMNGNEY